MINFLGLSAPNTTTPLMLEEALQKPNLLNWYIVPIFVFVLYIVFSEIKKKNYSVVMGAVAFWLMDVINETWNSVVYAATGQPVWGTTAAGNSALQILIGYNIEISFMFLILGIVACKFLKTTEGYEGIKFFDGNKNYLKDQNNMYFMANVKNSLLSQKERKIKKNAVLGRIIPAVGGAIAAVIVEILLNACGVLTWEKSWWQPEMPIILFLIGYCPFFFAAYVVHDLPRKSQLIALSVIFSVAVIFLIITGALGMLGPQLDSSGIWIGKWLR